MNPQPIVVHNYKGTHETATAWFQRDCKRMADSNYYPISQQYTAGQYGCGAFLIALILCFFIIGFLVFIYMLIVKPEGSLSVTYEHRPKETSSPTADDTEKSCPMCAERVKMRAVVCRFCGHKFII